MATQQITARTTGQTVEHDVFDISIDDLVAQLALDNYCLVPCQD